MPHTPAGNPTIQNPTSEQTLVRAVNWLVGAFVAALWVFFALWARNYQSISSEHSKVVLDRQRSAISEHVDSVFRLSEALLAGANTWITDHPERDPRKDSNFVEYVRGFQRVTGESMHVRMVEDDGTLVFVASEDIKAHANVADRNYFRAAMKNAPGELHVSRPVQGRATGDWAIVVATRLSKPSHGISVIFVAINLEIFDKAFKSSRLPEGGAISLVRSDGILLTRSGMTPVRLGKDISRAPMFTEGLAHADHGVIFTEAAFTDKIPKLLAYGRLPKYPLVIGVSESIAAIDQFSRHTILMVALALFFVTIAALLARWRVLLLLEKLSANRSSLALTEQNLRRALELVEKKERSKSQFLVATSHDLRQPLCAAQLCADSLDSAHLDGQQRTFVQKIQQALTSMSGQLHSLLEMSRLEDGECQLFEHDIKTADLFHGLASTFAQVAESEHVRLLFHAGDFVVHTDNNLVSRLLGNLIDNAIKFSPGGTVLVCVRRRNGGHVIQVRDNGEGMADIQHEAVFDGFYQVRNKERGPNAGYGLGLAIVSRLADLLGCQIYLASVVGKGSVFSLFMPKRKYPGLSYGQPRVLMPERVLVPRSGLVPATSSGSSALSTETS